MVNFLFTTTALSSGTVTSPSAFTSTANAGVIAYNPSFPNDFTTEMPLINIAAHSRLMADASNSYSGALTSTKMQATMPAGGSMSLLWAWTENGDWPSAAEGYPEFYREYAVRHNLPAAYTVTTTSANTTVTQADNNGRMQMTVDGPGNWSITISGPSGAMPDDWYMQVIAIDHEALYDNSGLSAYNANRHFRPAFLALLDLVPTWRAMNWNLINEAYNVYSLADISQPEHSHYQGMVPMQLTVALCNEKNMNLFWNQWAFSDQALIDYCAEYIRDNLTPTLRLLVEYSNETWNGLFDVVGAIRAFMLENHIGRQGVGTISGVAGTNVINGVGTNFPNENTGTVNDSIAVNGRFYQVDWTTATETTVETRFGALIQEDFNGEDFWVSDAANWGQTEGGALFAMPTARTFHNVFEAAGRRDQLINLMGGQLANTGLQTRFNDLSTYGEEDPKLYFDGICLNPYIGSSLFQTAGVEDYLVGLFQTDPAQASLEMAQICLRTHPTYEVTNTDVPSIRDRLQTWSENMRNTIKTGPGRSGGMEVHSYECNFHITHSVVSTATDGTVELFDYFLNTTDVTDVLDEWIKSFMTYVDGPIVLYAFMRAHSRFGAWGIKKNYDHNDNRSDWVANIATTVSPWWNQLFGPAQTYDVEAQTGDIDLRDYTTPNTTQFIGSIPGYTNNGDGTFTRTSATPGTYNITAANDNGSITVPVLVA